MCVLWAGHTVSMPYLLSRVNNRRYYLLLLLSYVTRRVRYMWCIVFFVLSTMDTHGSQPLLILWCLNMSEMMMEKYMIHLNWRNNETIMIKINKVYTCYLSKEHCLLPKFNYHEDSSMHEYQFFCVRMLILNILVYNTRHNTLCTSNKWCWSDRSFVKWCTWL